MLRPVKEIPRAFGPVGIFLIVAAGLVHLVAAPDCYEEATYIGVLFSANLLGAYAAAIGIHRDELWGWPGAAVVGGAFAMFVVSRLTGLPGLEEHVGLWIGHSVEDYLGIPSLIAEASFAAPFVVVILRARARALAQESGPHRPRPRERVGTVLLIWEPLLCLLDT